MAVQSVLYTITKPSLSPTVLFQTASGVVTARAFVTVNLLIERSEMSVYYYYYYYYYYVTCDAMHFLNSCLTLNSISSRITSPALFTSTEHPGTAGDRAVLVARHALVDAEVVGFRLQDGQRVAAVVCAHDAHPASLRQQLLVAVPRQQRHRVADDVHPQRAAVAHVVRLVADLLLEDRRKTCTDHPHGLRL